MTKYITNWNVFTSDINGENFNHDWNVYCDNLIMDGERTSDFYNDFYNFLESFYLNDSSILLNFSSMNEAVLDFLEWLFSITNDPEYDNIETVISIWRGTNTRYNGMTGRQYFRQNPQQLNKYLNY